MPDFADLAFRSGASYQPESVSAESEIPAHRNAAVDQVPSATVGVVPVGSLGYRLGGRRAYNRAPATSRMPPGTSSALPIFRTLCDAAFDR